VQESRFPRSLDFILIEPCSQLQWRYHVEPRQITTGTSSLHLVDQATLEMFVAVLLDENEHSAGSGERDFEFGSKSGEDLSREEEGEFETEEEPRCVRLELQQSWSSIQEADEESSVFLVNEALPGTSLAVGLSKK
jgi:hypothetical protein